VGTDVSSTHPAEVVGPLPKIGFYRNLSTEGVLSLGPKLVICNEHAGPAAVLDQLRAAGVTVAVLPADPTLDGARARIRTIGTLLDAPDAAAKLVASIDASLGAIRPTTPAPRVLFVYVTGAGALQVAGTDTAADAMIGLAGGKNAAVGWSGYRSLTAEGVIAARPDVILATDRGLAAMGGVEGLWALPGLAATPAGAGRRLVAMDELLLLGFGPRTGEAATRLAAALKAP
jgi:iron complex transport system substrate-binding protein